jgi:hypothetical protein
LLKRALSWNAKLKRRMEHEKINVFISGLLKLFLEPCTPLLTVRLASLKVSPAA